ncbi:hypothetical protein Tco_0503626 [Tanacetum coccineum]
MAGSDDEIPPPPPPPQTSTQQAPHTVSTIKLLLLKKGEYDIWAMKMEHYLSHTDYPIWEVIQKGNGHVSVSIDTNGVIKVLPPKTAEEILAKERERKARTTFLMALPEDHLAKFHKMTDAKDMWDAIKSRFGGNDESKKMKKYILKQQFEGFSVSNLKGLHKGYDRFQSLLSQLEIHGAGVSTEDANQKFLRVFESDVKGSTRSSSSTQNVAFVSSESTSSTNDLSTAYDVSTSSGYNSQRENSLSYTNELMYLFFANKSSGPHLDHEDLEQLDEFNLEEMDLKWQVAMISMRLKKFYNKTGRSLQFDAKEPVGFDKTKEEPKALVTLDGEGVDWTGHAEDEQENFTLMAYSNSGSDTEVTSCSKECMISYAKLKKLYDEQREQLGDASIEIQAYTQALKKVEAQLVTHQKNQLWYEEKIRFMKIDLDDKTDVLTYHKKLLAESVIEKEELKTKLENFQSSSKGLSKLLSSQMSKRNKSGLGSSDVEDSPVHDRFANVEGMHEVPPPMTGNYMPSGPDREVDDSMFTYGPKQSKTSESDTQTIEPNVVSQSKVWPDAPIIEEYESDSDDEYVIQASKEQERPINTAGDKTVSAVRGYRENVSTAKPSFSTVGRKVSSDSVANFPQLAMTYQGIGIYTASIDGQAKTITEASLRRHLKLEDNGGILSLPNTEIFEQLALMWYATDSDKLTFQKGNFSSQWRFFIHTILHRLSPKKTSWEQFSSNIATAIICLATNRTFNFSKFIFDAQCAPSTSPAPITETTPTAEEPALMPYESPLQSVQSLGRDEEIQEKISDDTEVLLEEEETAELVKEPTELVEDQGSGKNEVLLKVDTARVIDWNDLSVIRLKRAGQDVEAKPAKRERTKEVSESVQEQTDKEPKTDELSQE